MIASLLLDMLLAKGRTGEKITLEDIESRFRELGGSATSIATGGKQPKIGAAVAAAALLVLGIYLLGRRKGRRRATVLEIRRIV